MKRKTLAKQWVFQATYKWKDGDNYYISGTLQFTRKMSLGSVLALTKQFHPNAPSVQVTIGPDEMREQQVYASGGY